jgi:DNA-binding response OmpR family regulator
MKESGILVVDDDRDNLNLIELFFMCEGYHIDCAGSGDAALKMLETNSFSAMLTDLHMPGMDGLELARRAREKDGRMTILLYTGDDPGEITCAAAEAGISRVFPKPFNLQILLDLVQPAATTPIRMHSHDHAATRCELRLVGGGLL